MLKAICFQHSAICFFIYYSLNTEFLKKMAEKKSQKIWLFPFRKSHRNLTNASPLPLLDQKTLWSSLPVKPLLPLLHSIFFTETQWSYPTLSLIPPLTCPWVPRLPKMFRFLKVISSPFFLSISRLYSTVTGQYKIF